MSNDPQHFWMRRRQKRLREQREAEAQAQGAPAALSSNSGEAPVPETDSPVSAAPAPGVPNPLRARRDEIWPPDSLVALGRFLKPHGISGRLRLFPYTRAPEELAERCPDSVWVWWPDGKTEAREITDLMAQGNVCLVELEGVESREEAERLRGAFLCLREGERWPLEEGEFYVDDLAGLEVVHADSGEPLGRVIRLRDGAAQDFLEIAPAQGGPLVLAPFARALVAEVNLPARRLLYRPPEGLFNPEEE